MNDLEKFLIGDEVTILKRNVADLQEALNKAHIRIKELLAHKPSASIVRSPSVTEEELVRKTIISRGLNPDNRLDVEEFWRDYHGIED